jgi:hypothetical protein
MPMISLRGKIFQIEQHVNDYWRDEELYIDLVEGLKVSY